ncbi:MAG: PaaI family thioesterase [Rhodospirillales bacterium]|jgi:uncharacterized protein (TIGR00369 family)|nr:PaaI family thioesterase [Rhodospirillales bacterium]
MAELTMAGAEKILAERFAPWVLELGIGIDEVGAGLAVLRVPPSDRLNRGGGTVCGQAIMALADTAMVIAISGTNGGFVPMTTVNQTSSFLRPAAAQTSLVARARLIKTGRTVIYGEVALHTGQPDKPVAHVTSTYMLL